MINVRFRFRYKSANLILSYSIPQYSGASRDALFNMRHPRDFKSMTPLSGTLYYKHRWCEM